MSELILLAQGVVVLLLSLLIKSVMTISSRLSSIETWQVGHEKQDDERFDILSRSAEHAIRLINGKSRKRKA